MVIDVPENLVIFLPYVSDVTVALDAFPGREFPAMIKEIGKEASMTTRTYPVTLLLDKHKDVRIFAGMAGEARVEKADLPETILPQIEIPISAIFSPVDTQQSYVWVIDKGSMTVSQRAVTLGQMSERGIGIEEGIKPGEWIVTAGVNFIRDGQKVTLMPEEIEPIG